MINDKVYPVRIPREPRDMQRAIRDMMVDKLGVQNSILISGIVHGCAEVAESLILRHRELTHSIPIFYRYNKNRKVHAGYQCPMCPEHRITMDFKYCSGCGRKIFWREPILEDDK